MTQPVAASQNDILIGLSGPYTGGSSPMGISMRNGVRMATQEINAQGGINGRQIRLIERDDRGQSDSGIKVAQELIVQQRVAATIGFVNSGVALSSQIYYQRAGIPAITAGGTASRITQQFLPPQYHQNFVFRVALSDGRQAPLIVREARRQKLSKLAIFRDQTNYGRQGEDELRKALRSYGMAPVFVGQFRLGERDMLPQLQAAKDSGAQAILTYAIGPELTQIANSLAQMDWRPRLIGSWTLSMSNFIDNAGPNGEGARMIQTFISDSPNPTHQRFVRNYLIMHGGSRIPSPMSAAQGYDSMKLLAAAIRQAGKTEGKAIVSALEDLKMPVEGVITSYQRPFSPDNHEAIDMKTPVIGELRQGRIVYAYPDEAMKKRHP